MSKPVITIDSDGPNVVMVLRDIETRTDRAKIIWTAEQARLVAFGLWEAAQKCKPANASRKAHKHPPQVKKDDQHG